MVKQFSATSLAEHDGRDGGKDVYIAVCGIIYNVNDKKELFQPGGPFDFCTGRDATRALALINAAQENLNGDVGDLGEDEKKCTEEWESFFRYIPMCCGILGDIDQRMAGIALMLWA
ncbi:cytochrome b5-like heme/steroid binding domain-containing protein [Cytidiella melzeri]|nr:cytochrome b5-like heme/steroid binding domain-containing protein [Cytidiella melzeri]